MEEIVRFFYYFFSCCIFESSNSGILVNFGKKMRIMDINSLGCGKWGQGIGKFFALWEQITYRSVEMDIGLISDFVLAEGFFT